MKITNTNFSKNMPIDENSIGQINFGYENSYENQVSVFEDDSHQNFGEKNNKFVDDFEISNFEDIKNYAAISGSADDVYKKSVESLSKNKDDPKFVQEFVDSILVDFLTNYDDNMDFSGIKGSNPEKLMQFVNTDETGQIPGAICETMHGLAADMLTEAGIPATVISGEQCGCGHATLLYKAGDNKYIWNNYGKSEIYEADNIEDAYKQVSKADNYFTSKGYLGLDSSNGSFLKVLYSEETALGEKIDKSSTDKSNLFDKAELTNENSFTVATNGLNVTTTRENVSETKGKSKIEQIDVSAQIKTSEDTKSFDKATSVGFDLDATKQFNSGINSLTFNTDLTFSTIKDSDKTNFAYLTGEANIIDKVQIAKDKDTEVSVLAGARAHANIALKTPSEYDYRFAPEVGMEIKQQNANYEFVNQMSIGVPLDRNQLEYDQTSTGNNLAAGVNFKGSSKLNYNISDDLSLSANAGGFYSHTPHFTHFGYDAEIGANYKVNNTTLFASAGVEHEREDLSINLINDTIKNKTELKASLGAEKGNASVGGSVSYNLDTKKIDGAISAKFKF